MDCKLLDCEEDATVRVCAPHGTINMCAAHGHALGVELSARTEGAPRPVLAGLADACRYGPAEDPPLEDDERGERFPRLQRRGPLTDVFGVGPLPSVHYGPEYEGEFNRPLAMVRCPHGKWWVEGSASPHTCLPCLAVVYGERGEQGNPA